ncbi:hypothetical protein GOV07_05480 [Candidatus Woesearchaeota archaeon]|nr:hypothetical protein [Candidatus Woesearchaeota archaeon]
MAAQGQFTLADQTLHYNSIGERLLNQGNLSLVLDTLSNVYGHARSQGAGTTIVSHYDPALLEPVKSRVPQGDLELALRNILTYDKVSKDNLDGALVMDGNSYRNRMHFFTTNWGAYVREDRGIEGDITPEDFGLIGNQLGTWHITAIAASADYAKTHRDSYVLVLSSSGTVRVFQDGYAILSSRSEDELARPTADIITCDEFMRRRLGTPRSPPPVAGALGYASPA